MSESELDTAKWTMQKFMDNLSELIKLQSEVIRLLEKIEYNTRVSK